MNAIGTLASQYLRDEETLSGETRRKVKEIEDLIHYRIPRIGLSSTIEGLRPDLWQLRFMAVASLLNTLRAEDLSEMITLTEAESKGYQDEFSSVEQDALEIYNAVSTAASKNLLPAESFTLLPDMDIPYEALQSLAQLPQWTFQYLVNCINSSLDLDIAFFVLAFHRESPIAGLDISELKSILRLSSERYGAYAQALDLWNPDPTTLSQPLMNAHLLGAIFSSKVSNSKQYTIEELTKRYTNNAA